MNYKYIKIPGVTRRINLEQMASTDTDDTVFPEGSKLNKNVYFIYFFTPTSERYEWRFDSKEARDAVYNKLPSEIIT